MASVRCYGSNYFGQLGLGETAQKGTVQQYTWSTAVLPFKCDSILDIQCGGHFTVVLDEDGCVYFAGQLNNFVYPSFQFVDTSLPIKCIQVACGRKHIVILLQGGYVLSWGAGYCGQLGLGDDSSWDYPRLVYSLDPSKLAGPVTRVFCGGFHSGALVETGALYMWGSNRCNQCGVTAKTDDPFIVEPSLVSLQAVGSAVTTVACGRAHTTLLTHDGRVYAWGAASWGRLGFTSSNAKSKIVAFPTEIPYFVTHRLRAIASGDFHNLGLGKNGGVYAWGYGAEGELGNGRIEHSKIPCRILSLDDKTITKVTCGGNFSFAISHDGVVYGWGHNDGDWLGISSVGCEVVYADADDSSGWTSLGTTPVNTTLTHTYSFESRQNILTPVPVPSSSSTVRYIRCGSDFSIAFSSPCSSDCPSTAPVTHIACSLSVRNTPIDSSATPIDSSTSSSRSTSVVLDASGHDISGGGHLSAEFVNACRYGRENDVLRYISSTPVNMEPTDDMGNTMLIIASQNGQLLIVKLLVEAGANLNAKNKRGNTCLHYSMAYSFEDVSRLLLSSGADDYVTNMDGLTCYEGLSSSALII